MNLVMSVSGGTKQTSGSDAFRKAEEVEIERGPTDAACDAPGDDVIPSRLGIRIRK